MTTMDNLHFQLRPSLLKLGLSVTLFIVMSAIFSHYFNGVLFGLAMLFTLLALYFFHDKNPVVELAQLDGKIWTLKNKHDELQQLEFISAQRLGLCVVLKFESEDKKIHHISMLKDQMSLLEWKNLQTFIELN